MKTIRTILLTIVISLSVSVLVVSVVQGVQNKAISYEEQIYTAQSEMSIQEKRRADLLPNLLQVVYATAAGFMFVMMYYKSKSLIACIIAHGVFNALSAFANEANATNEMRILTAALLTAITGSYALYLALSMKGTMSD